MPKSASAEKFISSWGRKILCSLYLVFILLGYLVIAPVSAYEQAQSPQNLLFSHIKHPQAESVQKLLRGAYKKLNIDVEFIEVPAKDGLLMLDRGLVDGDLARPENVALKYSNFIVVNPPIYTGQLFLICSPRVACVKDALFNSTNTILTNVPDLRFFNKLDVKAKLNHYSGFTRNIELLQQNRSDYLLYAGDKSDQSKIDDSFDSIHLLSFPMYHILHKRHAHLLSDLQQALRKHISSSGAFVPKPADKHEFKN